MIVIVGLLVLILAAAIAVVGVADNTGGAHPLGGSFDLFGLHLSGLSIGQLFLWGIVVGAVAMLGLSMLLGAFSRRVGSRRSRRELQESQHEVEALRLDRDRLAQQLDSEQAERRQVITPRPREDSRPADTSPPLVAAESKVSEPKTAESKTAEPKTAEPKTAEPSQSGEHTQPDRSDKKVSGPAVPPGAGPSESSPPTSTQAGG